MFKRIKYFALAATLTLASLIAPAYAVLPNIFATQPSGNVAASLLDTNFTFLEIQGVQGFTTTGSSNAYIATPPDAWLIGYSSYVGRALTVIPNFTNSATATINVSGLGTASLYKNVGGTQTALSSGDMVSGTPVILICDGTGFLVANPTSSSFTPGQLPGTATNDNAASGNVGEYITASAGSVSISNNTPKDITSISLTAGDWDVTGNITVIPAASTVVTSVTGWISTTSATQPSPPNNGAFYTSFQSWTTGTSPNFSANVGTMRLSLSSTTTVYFSTNLTFTTSTAAASGFIRARRVR